MEEKNLRVKKKKYFCKISKKFLGISHLFLSSGTLYKPYIPSKAFLGKDFRSFRHFHWDTLTTALSINPGTDLVCIFVFS